MMEFLLIALISVVIYIVAAGLHASVLMGKLRANKTGLLIGGAIAVISQAYWLYHTIMLPMGQNLSLLNVFSLLMWIMAVLLIVVSLRKPMENLCLLVFPLASLSIALVLLFPHQHMVSGDGNAWQIVHIILSFISLSILAIACLQALVLASQDYLLQRKPASKWLAIMPPMQAMERLLFQLLNTGFVLLTLMLLTAIYFIRPDSYTIDFWHKAIFGLLAWLFFAFLLFGRLMFGWRGRLVVRLTLLGFVILFIAYLGSRWS